MTRKLLGALALAAMAGTASADYVGTANLAWSIPLDQLSNGSFGSRASAGSVYSNIDTPSGFFIKNGGATSIAGGTKLIADKLTCSGSLAPISGSQTGLTKFTFSMVNGNSVSVSYRPRVRFWRDNGSGAPGLAELGISFTNIVIPANTASGFFSDFSTFGWIQNGFNAIGGDIWVGMLFDGANAGSTAGIAALNNMGILAYNPPAVGSSADNDWLSTSPGSNFSDNPIGATRASPFAGAPVANYYYELAPTPGSLAVLGLGGLIAARRRRA